MVVGRRAPLPLCALFRRLPFAHPSASLPPWFSALLPFLLRSAPPSPLPAAPGGSSCGDPLRLSASVVPPPAGAAGSPLVGCPAGCVAPSPPAVSGSSSPFWSSSCDFFLSPLRPTARRRRQTWSVRVFRSPLRRAPSPSTGGFPGRFAARPALAVPPPVLRSDLRTLGAPCRHSPSLMVSACPAPPPVRPPLEKQ